MKIGLIAVSGVRIYNDRLRKHGVTLPGFVERAKVIASMPSLGLLTLAGAMPERHQVTYLECPDYDEAALRATRFDLVAVSSFTAMSDVMYKIADFYRARGTTVVLGGLHVTLVPDEAALHADAIVVGEGEKLWPRLLQDCEQGRLRKIYRNGSFQDVQLGHVRPRYDLLDVARYNRMPVQTTRGCPLHCEFCAASRIFGGYKLKPVDAVVREIREIKKRWKRPFIEFADDNTFVNKTWSKELVRAVAEEGVRWFTETDVSVAEDPELLDLLSKSGCRQLLIGFESPTPAALQGMDRAGWKASRYKEYRTAIDAIQDHGISVNGCFIVGNDTDTPDIFPQIERFAKSSGLADVQVTVLTPFPGTSLHERLKREGRLLREHYWERCTLFDVNFVPRQMSVQELEQGLEYLMGSLYTTEESARRRDAFVARARKGLRTAG
ncbi:MAG: B12-binding domain-containing radical SAM protein [Planctomycetes bacterium]|nr:B12-binding domain-containing radical SAM protein [Planctomycetota bacterium]